MGYETFAQQASQAGVDATLIVDLPPEESKQVLPVFKQYGLDSIYLLSPTTNAERIAKVCQAGSGFVYYVSLKGVTGANTLDVNEVAQRLDIIRRISDLPIGVGFGVKDAQTAAAVSQVADAVVVGSVLVKMIEENADNNDKIMNNISDLLLSMRYAMDSL
jgi:tryptophan synthase alpha chain